MQYAIFFFFGRQNSLLKFVEGIVEQQPSHLSLFPCISSYSTISTVVFQFFTGNGIKASHLFGRCRILLSRQHGYLIGGVGQRIGCWLQFPVLLQNIPHLMTLHLYHRVIERLSLRLLNMMKHKGRSINKRVTIQQHPQQTSTKSFAFQKRKKIVYCIFNFLFPLF